MAPEFAERWEGVLAQPLARIAKVIGTNSQDARDLRQSSPFAGVLTGRERRRVLDLVVGLGKV